MEGERFRQLRPVGLLAALGLDKLVDDLPIAAVQELDCMLLRCQAETGLPWRAVETR